MIKQNMSGNSCHHCHNLLSTEPVFRRACCEGCFHQWYIQSEDLIHCPSCRLDSLRHFSGFRWFPYSLMMPQTSPLSRHGDWRITRTTSFPWRNWRKWQRWWPQKDAASNQPTFIVYRVDVICVCGKSILLSVNPKCQHSTTEANWYPIVDILRNSS